VIDGSSQSRLSSPSDDVIYIFTTAGKSKPTYRRGILDLLAYPAGHIQQFSYRRSDIHPLMSKLIRPGKNKKGVVVFVDVDAQRIATYVPLRQVAITEIYPALGSDPPRDPEERVKLFLLLDDYVEYPTAASPRLWHEALLCLDTVREVQGERARYFVVPGPVVFDPLHASELLTWENLVRAVSQSARFGNAFFLRLNHLKSYRRRRKEVRLVADQYGPRSYSLTPGHAYQLDFEVFANPNSTRSQKDAGKVTLTCSSELVEITKPFQSVVSGLVQQCAILSCKRTIENTGAVLSVEIVEPEEGVVNTPNPVLLLQVSVSRPVLIWFVILVFLGGLLVSSDKDALATFTCSPELWVWLAKFFGSILLAAAAFLAFRKLPSGRE
jgi:hypothetical protein